MRWDCFATTRPRLGGSRSSAGGEISSEKAVGAAVELAQLSADEAKEKAINYAAAEAADSITRTMSDLIPTFEFSWSGVSSGKPTIGILGLAPLVENENDLVFTQFSVFNNDGRQTLNLGLGYRELVMGDQLLWGVNAFYDHEFPYDHGRASIGAELRSSVAELNANYYEALTSTKVGRNGQNEDAMDGFDLEAGVVLPYMPSVKAYAKYFEWNGTGGTVDLQGARYSLSGEFYPGVNLELGRTYYQHDAQADANFVKVNLDLVKLAKGAVEVQPLFQKEAFRYTSMREHRYDKVRRENLIKTQTSSGTFTATASGV